METNNLIQTLRERVGAIDISPDTELGKIIYNTPVALWRLGFGPLLGRFMLVLTTTGRNTGEPRRGAIEFRSLHDKKYIMTSYPEAEQWYLNLLSDPYATIQTAKGSESVKAVRVDNDVELLTIYRLFKRYNPFLSYDKELGDDTDDETILANKDRIFIFRFDPISQTTPPGQEVDLAWIWPALIVINALGKRRRRG